MIPEDKIRCSVCEGWGVTSYEADGSPNACAHCGGTGVVARPVVVPTVYGLTDCQAAIKALLELAAKSKDSENAEASDIAYRVLDLFEDFDLIEADNY